MNDYSSNLEPPLCSFASFLCDPGEAQVSEITAYLTRARHRFQIMDAQISALIEERDSLAESIRMHESVISVIRRLPTEILCRIFSLTLPRLAHMEIPPTPWSLALVNRRWRDVATTFPALWTSFGVHTAQYRGPDGLTRSPNDTPSALDRLTEQLRRSADLPLHITIEENLSVLTETFDILMDVRHRWETLCFRGTRSFFTGIEAEMVMLRRICVASRPNLMAKPLISLEFETVLPELISAAYNIMNSIRDKVIPCDWGRLTHYDGAITLTTFPLLLQQARELVDCRLIFYSERYAPQPPDRSQSVELRNLQQLSISITECLAYLTAPRLEELAVDGHVPAGCHTSGGDPNLIIDFLARSSCTLLRLSLLRCTPNFPLFQAVPSLIELTLQCDPKYITPFLPYFFPAAAADEQADDTPPLFPNLTALSVEWLGTSALASAVEMLSARFHMSHTSPGYRKLEFFGLLIDVDKQYNTTKIPHKAKSVFELLTL
ncbi:hypothetical protein R3P38DRAFT_2851185, partial [Favolaschia claudopus]